MEKWANLWEKIAYLHTWTLELCSVKQICLMCNPVQKRNTTSKQLEEIKLDPKSPSKNIDVYRGKLVFALLVWKQHNELDSERSQCQASQKNKLNLIQKIM